VGEKRGHSQNWRSKWNGTSPLGNGSALPLGGAAGKVFIEKKEKKKSTRRDKHLLLANEKKKGNDVGGGRLHMKEEKRVTQTACIGGGLASIDGMDKKRP